MPKDHDGMIAGESVKTEAIVAMAEKNKMQKHILYLHRAYHLL